MRQRFLVNSWNAVWSQAPPGFSTPQQPPQITQIWHRQVLHLHLPWAPWFIQRAPNPAAFCFHSFQLLWHRPLVLGFANPGPGLELGLNAAAPVQALPRNPPTTPVEKRAVNQPAPTCLSGLPCHFPLDISIILLCLQLRTSTKRPLLSSSSAAQSNKAAQAPAPAETRAAK